MTVATTCRFSSKSSPPQVDTPTGTCKISAKLDAQVTGQFIIPLIWTCVLRRDEPPSGAVSFTILMTEGTQMSSTEDMSVFQTANVKEDESHSLH